MKNPVWAIWLGIMILNGQAIVRHDWLAFSAIAAILGGLWKREVKSMANQWSVEETDEYWELYRGRTSMIHGHKIMKIHKSDRNIACYWPNARDTAYIIKALNEAE